MKTLTLLTTLLILMGCQKNQNPMLEKSKTVEHVSFKINENFSVDEGKNAMKLINGFVSEQPGFIARVTSVNDNNEFLDIVFWESLPEAKAAAKKIEEQPSLAKSFEVIDMESMVFGHFEVFNVQ